MKINKSSRKTQRIILVLATITLVAAVAAAWYFTRTKTAPAAVFDNSSVEEQRKATEEQNIKERFIDDSKTSDQNQASAASSPNSGTEVSIRSLYQDSSRQVVATTLLEGSSWTDCTITFTRTGSPTVTKMAKTLYVEGDTICEGFTIPRSEFSDTGSWQAKLVAKKVNGESYETSKSIDLR